MAFAFATAVGVVGVVLGVRLPDRLASTGATASVGAAPGEQDGDHNRAGQCGAGGKVEGGVRSWPKGGVRSWPKGGLRMRGHDLRSLPAPDRDSMAPVPAPEIVDQLGPSLPFALLAHRRGGPAWPSNNAPL